MSKRAEHDLDMALAALAREVTVQPDRGLGEAVLSDAALTILASEAAAAAPLPRADLVARVLGDAAEVTAERARAADAKAPARHREAPPRKAQPQKTRTGLLDLLFGWQTGAVAMLMLALGLGVGVGLELDPEVMSFLDNSDMEAPITLAALDGDLMGMDGL